MYVPGFNHFVEESLKNLTAHFPDQIQLATPWTSAWKECEAQLAKEMSLLAPTTFAVKPKA
jgi:hypothetical protein